MSVGEFFGAIYSLWNQIIYALSNIRFFDILDIVVIAFIIYKAIEFLKETRAGQLVKGLVVLLVAFAIARWWELAVLNWLLSAVIDSAIIALAVIFQPELRRILENMGHTKLARSQMLDKDAEHLLNAIDSIGRAAGLMQEKRIGALIVFEKRTQLGEIINTGTVIDAETSVSMVNNIFFPKSPLHDGATIVRDGRLFAAGCILPLTQNNTLSSQLGTRHRAAIGMSENSDAVVLVVSEETGNISIVENGQIERGFNGASACAELRRRLIDSELAERDNVIISALKHINPFRFNKKKEEAENETENPKA